MKTRFLLPEIPADERTPLVDNLLMIIEQQQEQIRKQDEEIQLLKDEIRVLKGEKKRPKFKASKMDDKTDPSGKKDQNKSEGSNKRPGSKKRSKNSEITIHEDKVIEPACSIPPGSRFKGYRDFIVQDLIIQTHNTRYRLSRWETPDGKTLTGELPIELNGQHFGPQLKSYILYQHHQCHVTQPLLLEQLQEWGVDISSGGINQLLSEGKEAFHQEKEEILQAGIAVSDYISVDDSGAMHKGKNGYVTQIGNEYFAWFESTDSKSRINFLELLNSGDSGYRISGAALDYWKEKKLPKTPLTSLMNSPCCYFADAISWEKHLDAQGVTNSRHRRIATEGALLANLMHDGKCSHLAIVSDDAGQFNILSHALCWVHAERLIHTLIPLNEGHREDIAKVRGEIWDFYAELKKYKQQPEKTKKEKLKERFDTIFKQTTRYETLNQTLKRLHKNKSELLLVLDRPEIPLHTNDSERDIRDFVKKKKVSGGTRSEKGRRCRDTFASLKKTCRKQGISFWEYLVDRVSKSNVIPPLFELIRQSATQG